jgi:hypothetical protein
MKNSPVGSGGAYLLDFRVGATAPHFSERRKAVMSRESFCDMPIEGIAFPGKIFCGSCSQSDMFSGEFLRKPAM